MAVEDDKPRMLLVIRLDVAMGDMGGLWGGNWNTSEGLLKGLGLSAVVLPVMSWSPRRSSSYLIWALYNR